MGKSKKILLLSSWYPTPEKPFLGNFVRHQAEVLSRDYDVTVLQTISKSDCKTIEFSETTTGNLREIVVVYPQGSNFLTRKTNKIQAFKKGLEKVEQPDIIHGHIILPNIYLFKIAKDFFKVPLIITEHSSNYRAEKRKHLGIVDRFLLRMAKQTATKIVSVSAFLKNDLLPFFSEEKLVVISNPVATDLFLPADNRKKDFSYFLHVSTLDKSIKNIDGILEAVQLLVQKGYEEVKLKIISDEPLDETRDKVNALGLNRYVTLDGPMSPTELVTEFQNASAFVIFSSYESFSIVIAEAWSTGLPVISTSVGIAHNMDEHLGFNVKMNDPLGLAIAMEKIVNDNEFSSTTIRKHALEFSEDNFLSAIEVLYKDLEK